MESKKLSKKSLNNSNYLGEEGGEPHKDPAFETHKKITPVKVL